MNDEKDTAMNNNSLTDKIKESLQRVHQGTYKGQPLWTNAFKNSLCELGERNNYKVYPNKKKESQWLLDLCWAKEGNNWQADFKGLKLACEIEWSRKVDDILYDFQKLTVIDSELRLMIFQYDNHEELKIFVAAIKTASDYTKSKGYNYLIAASGNNEDELQFGDLENIYKKILS